MLEIKIKYLNFNKNTVSTWECVLLIVILQLSSKLLYCLCLISVSNTKYSANKKFNLYRKTVKRKEIMQNNF